MTPIENPGISAPRPRPETAPPAGSLRPESPDRSPPPADRVELSSPDVELGLLREVEDAHATATPTREDALRQAAAAILGLREALHQPKTSSLDLLG